jgi:prephenate dehydrogenase/chorismate mutase/prephenate dehydrogenase
MQMKKKLELIDKSLIELLGDRIALLSASKLSSIEEQSFDASCSLSQAGVPDFVWHNLIVSCAAAVASSSSPTTNHRSQRITIIGGRGMMGSFFASRLSIAGHQVAILESDDWERADRLLTMADLVLICVPIEYTEEVIRNASRFLSPNTALADITSIKVPMVQAMLKYHAGPVMGLHPMFGPGINSFLSQKVLVCPGRADEAFAWLLNLIENDGGQLIVCSPEEHDRMMVTIQAIRHFATFSLGVFLADEKIDFRRSLDFSSPSYRLEVNTIGRLFAQSAPLVVDIMLATQERTEAIDRLANTYNRLAKLVVNKDRDALLLEFQIALNVLKKEIACTFEESDLVINSLIALLTAKKVKQTRS